MSITGRRICLRGTVQGVGFRPFVHRLAHRHGLGGRVRNDASGVTIEVFGEERAVDAFLAALSRDASPGDGVDGFASSPIPAEAPGGFAISDTESHGSLELSIAADRATCDECLAEIADPADRRHGHAFATCTRCGPRYSIVRSAPYDRAATTMADFAMCSDCRHEYDDPFNRRFHAESIACPACGPRLSLQGRPGEPLAASDPVEAAAGAVSRGRIVAVKGIGGFHLVCDATNPEAVATLRLRKGRDEKPFAVMVPDLEAAEALAVLGEAERALLLSPERPIVLVPRTSPSKLAGSVAPGLGALGLLLPYTPLHRQLALAAGRPLVVTSANRSGDPLLFRDSDAVPALSDLADLLLGHDREIAAPCEDSVARLVDGAPMLLRRGRGFVPRPIRMRRPFAQPVLGCGGDWKNAVCVGVGDRAWLAPQLGDLGSVGSYEALEESVLRLCRLLRVQPEILAHDLHPGFLSTRFAGELPAAQRIGVQHHHAHLASALAEHGLEGPVLGLVYDGTGFGGDGSAWGGELLLADARSATRLGSFRPLPLAGGDAAIRQVWRLALALLDDAFEGNPPLLAFDLFRNVSGDQIAQVRRVLATRSHAPPAHGVGRLFDAVGALLLGHPVASYEGQVALRCNELASWKPAPPYPFAVDPGAEPWLVDLRPMTRALVADHLAGVEAPQLSARFHETLVAASSALIEAATQRHGALPVVLSGGCFQNPRLAKGVYAALSGRRKVYLHREVPPGDGGIAVGQALVADARSRSCA